MSGGAAGGALGGDAPPPAIFALASGAGRAGVAVIRISGAGAIAIAQRLTGGAALAPRRARLTRLRDAAGVEIDRGLVLAFPAPASFTGEDVAEFHVHGGPAVIEGLFAALTEAGARPAEPGEFTRRAYQHGKLDLVQAEALADLIDAETTAQRRQALAQLDGELSAVYEDWRARLIDMLALLEAEIDFPDEADAPDAVADRLRPGLQALTAAMAAHLDDSARGERVREGFAIILIGAPNVGKSSLLNRMAGRPAAIVSDIPGTTRDMIEVRLNLGGYLVTVIDTAGLRDTTETAEGAIAAAAAASDAVEREGMRRARARAATADLRIGVVEADADSDGERIEAQLAALDLGAGDLAVVNKIDLAAAELNQTLTTPGRKARTIAVSAKTGEGADALLSAISEEVAARLARREAPALTRARHRRAVAEAAAALARAETALDQGAELAAEDIRLAARALGRLTGAVDVEEILGAIFAQFCIGK